MKRIILLFLVAASLIFFKPVFGEANNKLYITFPKDAKHIVLVQEEGQSHILITVMTKDNECLQFKMLGARFIAFKACDAEEWNTNIVVN